jgi:nitrite reductase (NADH) large subunit
MTLLDDNRRTDVDADINLRESQLRRRSNTDEAAHVPPTGNRIVVVGNGMAGARTVEEILTRDPDRRFEITMFGEEPYGNYNRILLSNLLAGVEQEDEIYLNSLDWYTDNDIKLHSGTKITKIDRWAKVVEAADGTSTPYDTLIIATGSRPFFPPLKGMRPDPDSLAPGIFGFRSLDDTRAMIAYAEGHQTAVVIGGGLLGLEAARGLQQNHGLDVHVVHATDTLMNQQLVKNAGDILLKSVLELGITVHMDAMAAKVHVAPENRPDGVGGKGGKVTGLEFDDGTVIACDMIVVTAGIRPVTELGVSAGLTVERAIVVDDQMRSVDDDSIYVVGECAQHRGEVYGLVAPLWEQGVVIAEHVTGENPKAAYHGSRTATKLKVAGVDVAAIGLKAPERDTDEYVVFSEPKRGVYKSVIVRDDKLVGATLLGDVRKVAFLTQAFDDGLPLPEERVELMFDIGGPAREVSAEDLPDESQVCNCNGVSKGELVGCARAMKNAAGGTTVNGVMAKTRAGKGCGTCKGLVKQIVEWAAGDAIEEDRSADWYVPGIPMEKPALMAAIRERQLMSVSAVFAALAPEGREDAASKMPLASLLKVMWNADYVDEKDARFINDRVHGNIQRDGTFSVVPQMKGGVTTPAQLKKIAEVAEKYEVPMVKVTGGQRIDLLGVRKEDLPDVWADLGMPSGYAYSKSFRTVKTCVGTDFCRFGLGDSTALGVALEERYQGLESPAKMKLAVAGCPRNCSEALVKDVGVVAVGDGKWDLLVGGAAGASVRKGDVLATVTSPEEVLRLAGRFMQYYRENANWLERTYDFVPRIGIEKLRELIVEDSDGLAEGLDARMQDAVDAYVDPWQQDGSEPATPGQFRPSLRLVDLPLVPVR